MNSYLINREDLSIFDKIKAFFKNILCKKDKKSSVTKNIEVNRSNKSYEFGNSLKVNSSNIYKKEDKLKKLMEEIEDNPDIIEKLSNDRLDKLINYYEKITESKRIKIEKLRASLK